MADLNIPQEPLIDKAFMEANSIDLIKVYREPVGLDGWIVDVRFMSGNCYTAHPLEGNYDKEVRSQKDVEDFVRWCIRQEKP